MDRPILVHICLKELYYYYQYIFLISPLARSTDASMEKLHSSSLDDDDEWTGVLSEAYNTGTWVYIGAAEEQQFWQRPESKAAGNIYV